MVKRLPLQIINIFFFLLPIFLIAKVTKPIIAIADARLDADDDLIPDRMGDTVTVAGRASVGTGILDTDRLRVAIQDSSSGIWLISPMVGDPINAGDSVITSGIVDQYRGETQLKVMTYRVVPVENRLPIPVDVKLPIQNLEALEGMLISTEGRIFKIGQRIRRVTSIYCLTSLERLARG